MSAVKRVADYTAMTVLVVAMVGWMIDMGRFLAFEVIPALIAHATVNGVVGFASVLAVTLSIAWIGRGATASATVDPTTGGVS